jgi:hypothetical protein
VRSVNHFGDRIAGVQQFHAPVIERKFELPFKHIGKVGDEMAVPSGLRARGDLDE